MKSGHSRKLGWPFLLCALHVQSCSRAVDRSTACRRGACLGGERGSLPLTVWSLWGGCLMGAVGSVGLPASRCRSRSRLASAGVSETPCRSSARPWQRLCCPRLHIFGLSTDNSSRCVANLWSQRWASLRSVVPPMWEANDCYGSSLKCTPHPSTAAETRSCRAGRLASSSARPICMATLGSAPGVGQRPLANPKACPEMCLSRYNRTSSGVHG
jgi:hypothetical protein